MIYKCLSDVHTREERKHGTGSFCKTQFSHQGSIFVLFFYLFLNQKQRYISVLFDLFLLVLFACCAIFVFFILCNSDLFTNAELAIAINLYLALLFSIPFAEVVRQGEYVPEPEILFKDTMASSHGKWAWSIDLEIRTEATGEDYGEHVEELVGQGEEVSSSSIQKPKSKKG
ncbi:uncharacterized protein [Medicago truncatula]|uniref:uncharacterized protein isoform X1 n=1 Tax=Medicago truncatula TaxID=3880 RepID=UPI0019679C50|nr:uncharacterized protein LOC25489033 isoform X1 [Medicago truncatula]